MYIDKFGDITDIRAEKDGEIWVEGINIDGQNFAIPVTLFSVEYIVEKLVKIMECDKYKDRHEEAKELLDKCITIKSTRYEL